MVEETSDVERLASEIFARARVDAQDIQEAAHADADELLTRARSDAEKEKYQRLARTEKEAQATIRRAISTAEVEARRLLLDAREELIDRSLDLAWQDATSRSDPRRRRLSLVQLAREAVAALGGCEVTLQFSAPDIALATPDFLAEIQDLLRRDDIPAVLTVDTAPLPIAGGVIATKRGGRLLFDNSFEARLDRLGESLREEVCQALFRRQPGAAAA